MARTIAEDMRTKCDKSADITKWLLVKRCIEHETKPVRLLVRNVAIS